MYTEIEIIEKMDKWQVLSSIKQFTEGYLVIKTGHTINYYRKDNNGNWHNYDCRTVY